MTSPNEHTPPRDGGLVERDDLIGRLWAFQGITPDHPSEGSFLNETARKLIEDATKRLEALNALVAEKDREIARLSQYANDTASALSTAEQQLAEAREALTPSADTKAAYIGEFKFNIDDVGVDEDGETFECQREVTVPWTTVKEIMAAIRARAVLNGGAGK